MIYWQVGEIFTFDGVFAVDRYTKSPIKKLRHFVITKAGSTKQIIYYNSWYPLLITDGPYKTITSIPSKLRMRRIKSK